MRSRSPRTRPCWWCAARREPAPLVVRWAAGDAQRVRAALAAAFGVQPGADGSIAVAGLRLVVADADVARGGRDIDRLEIRMGGHPAGSISRDLERWRPAAGGPSLQAVGWATVDTERAAGAWGGVRWAPAARDSLVGARAVVGEPTVDGGGRPGGAGRQPGPPLASTPPGSGSPRSTPVVLLEPDTEGRLAAALARHGEGPAVLYVDLPEAGMGHARRRLERLAIAVSSGAGPFGPELAIAGRPAWSPTVILVTSGASGVRALAAVRPRPDAVPSGHDRTSHAHVPGRGPG